VAAGTEGVPGVRPVPVAIFYHDNPMINRQELEESLDFFLQNMVGNILRLVPNATHLTDDAQELNEDYYLRHRIETIKRIRMTSRTDALALARMVEEDYEAARWWGHYTAQEMTHDLLYMKDLRQHGLTDEDVAAVQPFSSTVAMLDYLTRNIAEVGSIAAVAYSIFVEWNSERASMTTVEKVEKKYSKSHVSGSKAHVGIDQNEDHYAMMLDVVHRLLALYPDETVLLNLLMDIAGYFAAYFNELHEATIGRLSPAAESVA
jgi:hypothetical protein